MGKGYGNLAASISSTIKSSTSSILIIFNSPSSSALLEYLKLPVPLVEAINNHMHSCKSPDKPVRQVRKLSEGFELEHTYYAQETY